MIGNHDKVLNHHRCIIRLLVHLAYVLYPVKWIQLSLETLAKRRAALFEPLVEVEFTTCLSHACPSDQYRSSMLWQLASLISLLPEPSHSFHCVSISSTVSCLSFATHLQCICAFQDRFHDIHYPALDWASPLGSDIDQVKDREGHSSSIFSTLKQWNQSPR